MIFGIDVSNYQAGIDMGRARAEGMDFVLAKVTEGTTYRNPAWPAQRDGARNAGLFLAGYHYVRTGNPAGEAAACKAWLGDTTIPIMLDWEQNGGDWNNFLAVLAAFRAAGLRVVFGYIPRWYWAQQGSPNIATSGLALVSSRYPTTNGGTPAAAYTAVTPTTWSGYGGLNPTILQFTDRATVAGTPIDANAFLGARDQLAALFGATTAPGSPTPALPVEDDLMASIPITPDAGGRFHHAAGAEAGGGSAVASKGWLTFGSTYGGTTWTVAALGAKGELLMYEKDIRTTNNTNQVRDLPDGTRCVTVEGLTDNLGTRPWASTWSIR